MKIRKGFVSNSSSSSFTVIGLMVEKDKLRKETEVRNCRCEVEGIESMRFCPKCGQGVMKKDWDWVDGVDDDGIGVFGFECDEENDSSQLIIYLPGTYSSSSDYDIEMTKLPENIYEMKDELKKLAEGLGIWNEDNFGFWGGQRYG